MLTTEPALRPYSGPKLLVTMTYWPTHSGSDKKTPGPATLLSLLFWPSICWSLLRPRIPLTDNPRQPLRLENLLSPDELMPVTNNSKLSSPSFSCTPTNGVRLSSDTPLSLLPCL